MASEDWRVDLLTMDGQTVGVAPVVNGSITWDSGQQVWSRATLTTVGDTTDWLTHRCRIIYIRDGVENPLFTGAAAGAPESHSDATVETEVSLLDLSSVVADDMIGWYSGVAAGANPLTSARAFLAGYPIPVSLPDVTVTLAADITWSANTSNLARINDLLSAAGCTPLYTTPMGALQSDPIVPLGDAPIASVFSPDATLYRPDWRRNRDIFAVPNRVTARNRAETPLDVAVDLPPSSRYSYESTGQRRVKDLGEVDAADLNILTLLAQRALEESQSPIETREIGHDWDPDLLRWQPAVEHHHHRVPVLKARVMSMQHTMQLGSLWSSTLQGVA